MNTTTATVRVDVNKLNAFDICCKQYGLSRTGAINLFITKVVAEQHIPFLEFTAEQANINTRRYKLEKIINSLHNSNEVLSDFEKTPSRTGEELLQMLGETDD